MKYKFLVFVDRVSLEYCVLPTPFYEELFNIEENNDTERFKIMPFRDEINDRIEKIVYVKFLRANGYKFSKCVILNFLRYKK